jgi:hypothetical protein
MHACSHNARFHLHIIWPEMELMGTKHRLQLQVIGWLVVKMANTAQGWI